MKSQSSHVFVWPEPPVSAPRSASQYQSQSQSQTPSQASRKRTRNDGSTHSSTTADFVVSTRTKAKTLLGQRCFHCEMESGPYSLIDVCHVISKTSTNYARYFADGLLDFPINDLVNSMILCKNCHGVYDHPEPGWTFLPADLEYFIQYEEKDFKRRQAIIEDNFEGHPQNSSLSAKIPPRRCPTAEEYLQAWISQESGWPTTAIGGAYARYTMPDYKQKPKEMRLQAWYGAPLAAILHAFRAILGNANPPEFVETSVKKKLRELQELYERCPKVSPTNHSARASRGLFLPRANESMFAHESNSALGLSTTLPLQPQESPTENPFADHPGQSDAQRLRKRAAGTSLILESRKRPRFSINFPRLSQTQSQLEPPTPAHTHKNPTTSCPDLARIQKYQSVFGEAGDKRRGTDDKLFNHVFRHDWKWGPEISTQEKIDLYLGLSLGKNQSL